MKTSGEGEGKEEQRNSTKWDVQRKATHYAIVTQFVGSSFNTASLCAVFPSALCLSRKERLALFLPSPLPPLVFSLVARSSCEWKCRRRRPFVVRVDARMRWVLPPCLLLLLLLIFIKVTCCPNVFSFVIFVNVDTIWHTRWTVFLMSLTRIFNLHVFLLCLLFDK